MASGGSHRGQAIVCQPSDMREIVSIAIELYKTGIDNKQELLSTYDLTQVAYFAGRIKQLNNLMQSILATPSRYYSFSPESRFTLLDLIWQVPALNAENNSFSVYVLDKDQLTYSSEDHLRYDPDIRFITHTIKPLWTLDLDFDQFKTNDDKNAVVNAPITYTSNGDMNKLINTAPQYREVAIDYHFYDSELVISTPVRVWHGQVVDMGKLNLCIPIP